MTEVKEKLTKAEERAFAKELVQKIGELAATTGRKLRFMEVCGTHTVAIFRAGLRQILPDSASAEAKSGVATVGSSEPRRIRRILLSC